MNKRYIRQIEDGFPYPIAGTFVRLRTDECLDPGPLRLKYLLATGEAIVRLLAMVVLCECREQRERDPDSPLSKGLSADFEKHFKRPAWGTWMQLTREGLKWLRAQQAVLTCPPLLAFWLDDASRETTAAEALGRLLQLRNGLSHDRIQAMREHEFASLCEQAQGDLEPVLEALDFLLDYRLTFISQIEVRKRRRHTPNYWHRLKDISGPSDDFHGDRAHLSEVLDSQTIVFAPLEGEGRFLNLDPLLLYEEAAGKAPDIFFYNGMKHPHAAGYSACRHGGQFDSSASAHSTEIADELQALLDLMTQPSVEVAA